MKSLTTTLALCALLTVPAHANWQKVDDFENGMTNLHLWMSNVELPPLVEILPDLADNSNNMLYFDSNAYGVAWGVNHIAITLPAPVVEGGQGSLYFRFYNIGAGHDVAVGLSPVTVQPDTEAVFPEGYPSAMSAPKNWADYEPMLQMFAPGSNLLRGRDSSAYLNSQIEIPANEWVEMWMLVDSSTDTASFYVKRASDSAPILAELRVDESTTKTSGGFRNGVAGDLVTFVIGTVSGSPTAPLPGDPFFIDDVYINPTTQTTSNPLEGGSEPSLWAGYEVTPGNDVNTTGWLGWLHVGFAPAIYSYSLQGWMYLPESSVGQNGAWAYIFRQP